MPRKLMPPNDMSFFIIIPPSPHIMCDVCSELLVSINSFFLADPAKTQSPASLITLLVHNFIFIRQWIDFVK